MKRNELKVGQEVFLRKVNNTRYLEKTPDGLLQMAKITKVGRKYFYVDSESMWTAKFDIKTFSEINDYTANYEVYFSKKEYIDQFEKEKKYSFIKKEMSSYYTRLSIEQIRKIYDIIKESGNDKK